MPHACYWLAIELISENKIAIIILNSPQCNIYIQGDCTPRISPLVLVYIATQKKHALRVAWGSDVLLPACSSYWPNLYNGIKLVLYSLRGSYIISMNSLPDAHACACVTDVYPTYLPIQAMKKHEKCSIKPKENDIKAEINLYFDMDSRENTKEASRFYPIWLSIQLYSIAT